MNNKVKSFIAGAVGVVGTSILIYGVGFDKNNHRHVSTTGVIGGCVSTLGSIVAGAYAANPNFGITKRSKHKK